MTAAAWGERIRPYVRAYAPAGFLLLSAMPGGLRTPAAWAVFSCAVFLYINIAEGENPLSGLGAWRWFGALILLACAFSPEPLNSFWWLTRWITLLAFFAAARRSGTEGRPAWFAAVFLLAAASSLTVLWQAFTGQGVSRTFEVSGMIGPNVNYSAAFMAAAFSGLAVFLLSGNDKKLKLLGAAGMALLGGTIVAINSRGAVLGIMAAAAAAVLIRKHYRLALYLTVGGLLLIALLPAENFNWLMKLYDPRSLGRFGIWKSALDASAASPFWGWGPGLFERAFELFKFPFPDGISYYGHSTLHAHGEILNLAAEAGIPAALLFVCAAAAAVFGNREKGAGPLMLQLFAVSVFAQSSVDIIFYSGATQVLFFGTLGLLSPAAGGRPGAVISGRWISAALLACALGAFALQSRFSGARGCALDPSLTAGEREACLRTALCYAPGDGGLLTLSPGLSLERSSNPAAAAARAESAVLARPKDPFALFEAARLYWMMGDESAAKRKLFRALALEPGFLGARMALAEVQAAGGNRRAAALEIGKIDAALAAPPDTSKASPYDLKLIALDRAGLEKTRTLAGKKRAEAR